MAALVTYAVASLLCAAATSVGALIALRFVQGLAGAGGIVISRAVVRDLHSGAAAVRLFSSLMLVTGLAPILAPLAGGQLLAVTSWKGIFLVARDPVRADRGARGGRAARDAAGERRSPSGLGVPCRRWRGCCATARSSATRSRAA